MPTFANEQEARTLLWVLNLFLPGLGNLITTGGRSFSRPLLVFAVLVLVFIPVWFLKWTIIYLAFSVAGLNVINADSRSSRGRRYLTGQDTGDPTLSDGSADSEGGYASDHFERRMRQLEKKFSTQERAQEKQIKEVKLKDDWRDDADGNLEVRSFAESLLADPSPGAPTGALAGAASANSSQEPGDFSALSVSASNETSQAVGSSSPGSNSAGHIKPQLKVTQACAPYVHPAVTWAEPSFDDIPDRVDQNSGAAEEADNRSSSSAPPSMSGKTPSEMLSGSPVGVIGTGALAYQFSVPGLSGEAAISGASQRTAEGSGAANLYTFSVGGAIQSTAFETDVPGQTGTEQAKCPNCGAPRDHGFSFCPKCARMF